MQLSLQWLNECLPQPVTASELADRLTMAGLEVDAILPAAAAFSGVVIGEILAREAHPEADRLSICQVSDGQEAFQVVCGAANAAAGLKVPFAKIDACLPDGTVIRRAKLRGVESQGMLCGASELGFEDKVDGLWVLPSDAVPGQDLREYLHLDDSLLELDLTPNRGDCLSLLGVAREVAALTQQKLHFAEIAAVSPQMDDQPEVALLAPEACPRYAARMVRAVDARAPTPLWMQERLRRGGIRSINAVVDVTNYVLLELGQPMHAFDLRKLSGGIRVRLAKNGETLRLLDGSEKNLAADALVIADAEKALALAGIMGGADSGVSDETRDVLLESAFFTPQVLAGKARQHGLHTDSSHRFERGVDPEGQRRALERATALLIAIAGGQPGPVVDVHQAQASRAAIILKRSSLRRLLGLDLSPEQVSGWLDALGCQWQLEGETWQVQAPSWRFDLNREVDLVEEMARLYGYQNLPTSLPGYQLQLRPRPEAAVTADTLRDCLVQRGYREAITYSFVEPEEQQLLLGQAAAVQVSNPIASDMAAMRLSLWPGLLKAWVGNRQRQQQRVRLFETGLVFHGIEAGQQIAQVAGLVSGPAQPAHWSGKARSVDFFDARADVEALLGLAGGLPEAYAFVAAEHPALHPGQSARIERQGQFVGWIGALHPDHQARLDVAGSVFLFELSLASLADGKLPVFKGLSRFPEVRRDIALVLDTSIAAAQVVESLRQWSGELLKELTVFDVFEGQGLGDNRRSLGFSLVFQHATRTLVDDEVTAIMARLAGEAAARWGATIRNG